jgi:hypothetical protein
MYRIPEEGCIDGLVCGVGEEPQPHPSELLGSWTPFDMRLAMNHAMIYSADG